MFFIQSVDTRLSVHVSFFCLMSTNAMIRATRSELCLLTAAAARGCAWKMPGGARGAHIPHWHRSGLLATWQSVAAGSIVLDALLTWRNAALASKADRLQQSAAAAQHASLGAGGSAASRIAEDSKRRVAADSHLGLVLAPTCTEAGLERRCCVVIFPLE